MVDHCGGVVACPYRAARALVGGGRAGHRAPGWLAPGLRCAGHDHRRADHGAAAEDLRGPWRAGGLGRRHANGGATKGNTNVTLRIGDPVAHVSGRTVTLDVRGQIGDGRTLVPARFVAEGRAPPPAGLPSRSALHWTARPSAWPPPPMWRNPMCLQTEATPGCLSGASTETVGSTIPRP